MTLDSSFSLPPAASSRASESHYSPSSSARSNSGTFAPASTTSSHLGSLVFGEENELLRGLLSELKTFSRHEIFPVCIFGSSGSGKSELAQWIAENLYANCQIRRLNATDFFLEFVDAVDLDNVAAFRQSFCGEDRVIIIDNLEELATKPTAIDELESILELKPHIVVTCNQNPADLPGFSYRVASRLLDGLSIPLSHPAKHTLARILKDELARYNGIISSDAANWIVKHVAQSIPEVKQAISSLQIQADFGREISLTTVKKIFGESNDQCPSLQEISKIVAKHQRLKINDLKSQSRKRSFVQARAFAVYIAREVYQYKYEELGKFFGNRDHSTIMHAHRKFENEILHEPELKKCVDEILLVIRKRESSLSETG